MQQAAKDNMRLKTEQDAVKRPSSPSCYAIADRLEEEIDKKMQETGEIPKRIYLGGNEWGLLCAFADGYFDGNIKGDDLPPRYNGMEIYVVMEDNHLFVA